jgi:hypothetical protein
LEVNDYPSHVNKDTLNELCSLKGKVIELNEIKDKTVKAQDGKRTLIRIKDSEDGNNVNEIANYFLKQGCSVK